MKTSILIVEDDKAIQNLLSATLDANSYQCFTAETGEKAIFLATAKNPDILILDLGLPDMDGVELITRIRSWSSCPIPVSYTHLNARTAAGTDRRFRRRSGAAGMVSL